MPNFMMESMMEEIEMELIEEGLKDKDREIGSLKARVNGLSETCMNFRKRIEALEANKLTTTLSCLNDLPRECPETGLVLPSYNGLKRQHEASQRSLKKALEELVQTKKEKEQIEHHLYEFCLGKCATSDPDDESQVAPWDVLLLALEEAFYELTPNTAEHTKQLIELEKQIQVTEQVWRQEKRANDELSQRYKLVLQRNEELESEIKSLKEKS